MPWWTERVLLQVSLEKVLSVEFNEEGVEGGRGG